MANELLSYDAILRDALDHFDNSCVAAKCVNRRYEKEAQNAKRGDSFYVPIPETPTVSDGPTLDLKDTNATKVLVSLDKQKHCDFTMTSAEMTHSAFPEFSEFVIKPRMEALANQVDVDILALTSSASMTVGTWGTDLNSIATPLAADQKLTEHGVPKMDRYMFLSPYHKAKLLGTSSSGIVHMANPGIPAGDAFKAANVGRMAGFDVMESPNCYTHTVGSDITVGNYSSGGTEGSTAIVASGAGTLAIGDVFTIAGVYDVNPVTKATLSNLKQFVVTAASSASTTINFAPAMYASGVNKNVSALPTSTPAITFIGTASEVGVNSIAFHRDAFGLVTGDLVLPKGVHNAAARTHKGIRARIITDYDGVNDRFYTRIDILYGVVAYRPDTHAVRMVGIEANT